MEAKVSCVFSMNIRVIIIVLCREREKFGEEDDECYYY